MTFVDSALIVLQSRSLVPGANDLWSKSKGYIGQTGLDVAWLVDETEAVPVVSVGGRHE